MGVGARVQAKHGKSWYDASVMRAEESRLRVHWRGWDTGHDAWVQRDPARVRRSQRSQEPTRVVEEGTHAQLVSKGGKYAEMLVQGTGGSSPPSAE